MTSRFQQASLNVPDPTFHNEPDNTCIATGHLYDEQNLVHCPSGKKGNGQKVSRWGRKSKNAKLKFLSFLLHILITFSHLETF